MEAEYHDLTLDVPFDGEATKLPSERDVHDVGSWEEQPNGNILMSIDRYSLRKHVFLNGGGKRSAQTSNLTTYAFFGKFYTIFKVWKKDGMYSIIEFKEMKIADAARLFLMEKILIGTPVFLDAAGNNLMNFLIEKIENR